MAQFFQALVNLCKNQPALILGLVSAAMTLAAAFGLHLLPGEPAAILAFVQAVLSIIAGQATVSKAKFNALVAAKKKAGGS